MSNNKNVLIFSTLTASVAYTVYAKGVAAKGEVVPVVKRIVIKGGANLANKHFETPRGVLTTLSIADYEILKENEVFKRHKGRNFILVDESSKIDVEKAVGDMKEKDKSAPKTEKDEPNLSTKK